MASFVFNIALGRVVEMYSRVKLNDPANSALVLVPIQTSGLESDAVLKDRATLAAVLGSTTLEQTSMGRKVLTDTDLSSVPSPDNVNDRYEVSLPAVTWTSATGNPISKILVCYDNDTTAGTDANIIPLTAFDAVITPDGTNIQLNSGVFFRGA